MRDNLIREGSITNSSYDFELSIKREKGVIYNYTYPKNKKLKGIVFIIPGFGDDTNSEYSQKLRDYVAKEFDVVAVSAIYHCFSSRLNNGGVETLDDYDELVLLSNLKRFNIEVETDDLHEILNNINEEIKARKDEGKLDKNEIIVQTVTILPKNNEYQNFGILQALDHINVLKELKSRNLNFIDNYPTILIGSSHGGYIANLIAKIVPNSIDCVIDNSSYVKPPLNYIIGKENNPLHEECRGIYGENLIINYFTKKFWSNNDDSFYYLSKDNYEIRDLSNKLHNKIMAKKSESKTRYIFYHSIKDRIAMYKDKEDFSKGLAELGFDVTLNIISNISQIDGNFIKSLEHGLDMSIKKLANIELPEALKIRSISSKSKLEEITYPCETVNYNFEDISGIYSAHLSPIQKIETKIIDNFEKNIKYFEEFQPEIYSMLASLDSAIDQGVYQNKYELIFYNNYFNLKELKTGNLFYSENSNKYAFEVSEIFKEKTGNFVFFGVGLGVHLERVHKNILAKKCFIIENDLELFKLSTFVTPYFKFAETSELFFSVFEDDDVFFRKGIDFINKSNEEKEIFKHFALNDSYIEKIQFLENISGNKDE